MGKTFQGDIPGNRQHDANVVANASVASGGANGRIGQAGPFAQDIRVQNAWWTPTGADSAGSTTASYRRLDLINGGPAGTVTASAARIATLGLTASHASLGPVPMVVDTTVTLASGSIVYFSQSTVGGTDATNTVLVAGQFALAYEVM